MPKTARSKTASVVPLHQKTDAEQVRDIVFSMEDDVLRCKDYGYALALISDGVDGAQRDAISRIAYDIVDCADKIQADREKVSHGLHSGAFPASA